MEDIYKQLSSIIIMGPVRGKKRRRLDTDTEPPLTVKEFLRIVNADRLKSRCSLCKERGHTKKRCRLYKGTLRNKCVLCGVSGHNRRKCPNTTTKRPPTLDRIRFCSKCGMVGVNSRTCVNGEHGSSNYKKGTRPKKRRKTDQMDQMDQMDHMDG